MTDPTPTIRTAEKDSEGPAKRRRRPALSCVECRNRKVKCDRKKPCSACKNARSTTCTYRPSRPGFRDTSPGARSASVSTSNDPDPGIPARSSPRNIATSNEFDAMVNRYVAPGIFGEHDKQRLKPIRPGRPSLEFVSHSKTGESALITRLLERVATLESEKAVGEGRGGNSDLPIRNGSDATTGQFAKSMFYGESHWMNAMEPYKALGENNVTTNLNTNRVEVNKTTELYSTVSTKIKQMARVLKTSRRLQPSLPNEVLDSIPPKAVCDLLLDGYLRTFEGVFRILHVPSFRQEYESYWTDSISEKPSLILKILLVCAIGVPFYSGPDRPALSNACAKWIHAAAQWLNGPHTKSRLNMAGVQIQILHLLARQVCSVDGDHTWILNGTLLRTAMHLGLHRDPAHFGKISVYHCEMRRRLWATVLELTAQSSLDMGMPPMISANDHDTEPPSNIDDDDIGEGRDTPLDEKNPTQFTDSSIQIAFTKTLPIRLEIIRLINNLRFDLSYEDVLQIGDRLNKICRDQTVFLKSALKDGHSITAFQVKMADSLVRRFVLCLHRPYFAKAKHNPQYHYSRKMCLDTSLAIYAPATEKIAGQHDDWTKMTHRCVGFYKSFFMYAMSTVYIELNSQIDEQKQASAIFAPLITTPETTSSTSFALPAQFYALRSVLVSAHETAVARLRNGETNPKGCVFISCALARIDALVSGEDPERAVLETAKKSVQDCAEILTEVLQVEHGGVPIDLSFSTGGKNTTSGDGANDVTGQRLPNGTDAGDDLEPSESHAYDGTHMGGGTLDSGIDGLLGGGLGNFNNGMDIDFDAYMSGQTLNAGSGDFHFGRSPEWFYDLNGWAAPGTGNWNLTAGYSGM